MMSLLSPGTFVGRWTLRSRREPRTAARVTCEVTGPGRVSLCALCVARRAASRVGSLGRTRLSRAPRRRPDPVCRTRNCRVINFLTDTFHSADNNS